MWVPFEDVKYHRLQRITKRLAVAVGRATNTSLTFTKLLIICSCPFFNSSTPIASVACAMTALTLLLYYPCSQSFSQSVIFTTSPWIRNILSHTNTCNRHSYLGSTSACSYVPDPYPRWEGAGTRLMEQY